MLFLLSPSKTQNFDSQTLLSQKSTALFLEYAEKINGVLSKYSVEEIEKLMNVSSTIANETKKQIEDFEGNSRFEKQALFAYTGQVYKGFELKDYTAEDFDFVQNHLLILSGFYGAVRPLDLIRPYRLEMKVKFKINDVENLYQLWRNLLTDYVNKREDEFIINLASKEYFSVLDIKKLKAKIISPVFKERKGDNYKVVAIFAKQARGKMVNWAVLNRISNPQDLRDFSGMGYSYVKEFSDDGEFVFVR